MRRHVQKGLVALGLTGLFGLGLVAVPDATDPPQFSPWSAPINLGTIVNSTSYDACPTIAKSGLSLFFRSNRPGGQGGFDIYVTQRDSLEDPWEVPVNLGSTINGPYNEYCSTFSPDGHWLVFVSDRPASEGGCGSQDLWISHRKDKRDDLGWETPRNLGCIVNSAAQENGPAWFEDEATGRTLLYFSSGRPGGLGALDIYVSESDSDSKGDFGSPSLVPELSTASIDFQPVLRKDGLEILFASNRAGGLGLYPDLWTSTRESTSDPWSEPVSLGAVVNSTASDFHPTLSFDGTTLMFASDRAGGTVGASDLWMSTRSRVRR
jgi:Tol biopolymer transport system component